MNDQPTSAPAHVSTDVSAAALLDVVHALLPGAALDLRDDTHKHLDHNAAINHHGGHWHLRIIWPGFDGMPRLARHRMVHTALRALWDDRTIHSLSLRLLAPREAL